MGDQQPIPYWDGRRSPRPATAATGQGGFGIASVCCFALFGLCVAVGLSYLAYGIPKNAEWNGFAQTFGALIWVGIAGLVLVPLGILCGLVGLTYPPERRAAAIVGLVLNGMAAVAVPLLLLT